MFTVDPNVVMQQFSPLFMSQWFLVDHAKNPCSSITCENGFLYVFKHVSMNFQNTVNEYHVSLIIRCGVFLPKQSKVSR